MPRRRRQLEDRRMLRGAACQCPRCLPCSAAILCQCRTRTSLGGRPGPGWTVSAAAGLGPPPSLAHPAASSGPTARPPGPGCSGTGTCCRLLLEFIVDHDLDPDGGSWCVRAACCHTLAAASRTLAALAPPQAPSATSGISSIRGGTPRSTQYGEGQLQARNLLLQQLAPRTVDSAASVAWDGRGRVVRFEQGGSQPAFLDCSGVHSQQNEPKC